MSKSSFYCDSNSIKRWEQTEEGYLRIWVTFGVPDQDLEYLTDSGKRIEYIDKESLTDSRSLTTLIGKPLTLNHPPIPIISSNWNDYAKGFSMQHITDNDDDIPVISAVIFDPVVIDGIISGKITKTSSAYWAEKIQQSDGRFRQLNRRYNHIALLTDDFEPRAGSKSEIVLDSITSVSSETKTSKDSLEDSEMTKNTNSENSEQNKDSIDLESLASCVKELADTVKTMSGYMKGLATDSKKTEEENHKEPQNDSNLIKERIELWSEWKSVLDENNVTIDYALDSIEIKKLVLKCFHEDSVIAELDDPKTLNGFYLAFKSKHQKDSKTKTEKSKKDSESTNQDSEIDWERQFIEVTSKIKN